MPKGPPVRIRQEVLHQIYRSIGTRPAEHGGVLGGDPVTGTVTRFWFDEQGDRTGGTYSPNTDNVNRVIDEEWAKAGVRFFGFVHSHPCFCRRPSKGDARYIRAILDAKKSLSRLLVPIVISEADGGNYELLFWVVERRPSGLCMRLAPVLAVDDAEQAVVVDPRSAAVPPEGGRAAPVKVPIDEVMASARLRDPVPLGATFNRVESAYDLPRVARSRLVFCGVGGMRETVGQAARSGIEEFVLIDPGEYEAANIGTQPCFRDEIGVAKVDAIKDEIERVNPNARVVALKCRLDDLDDHDVYQLLTAPMLSVPLPGRGERFLVDVAPAPAVIVGGTDDFYAQARINRLGLKFGCPTMLSALYRHGVGAELTWTYPGVSRSCHRCVLWCRYEAFLKEGYKNTVTSHGTPIFATQRLSSLEMLMILALLHHGSGHPRFGPLLGRIGQRNLVQVRLDPEFTSKLGLRVFDRVFERADQDRLLLDESVWLPQTPEDGTNSRRVCPECGGTGDLRGGAGRFADTRVMPA